MSWKKMYSSLITCRLNVLLDFPQEYRYIPIKGEPQITDNNVPIRQDWSLCRNLNDIIDKNGNFKRLEDISEDRKPLEFEYKELRRTLTDFIDIYSGGRLGANSAKLGVTNDSAGAYNVYGRLITKRKKGCSHYYGLLNVNSKRDGWVRCGIKLEDDLYEEGIDWEYDECVVLKIIMQVLRTPYLNRLKQFYFRLIKNNLYLGKSQNLIKRDTQQFPH